MANSAPRGIRVIFVDLIETCLDWHTAVVNVLPKHWDVRDRMKFAVVWRDAIERDIRERREQRLPTEDVYLQQQKILEWMLSASEQYRKRMGRGEESFYFAADQSERKEATIHRGLNLLERDSWIVMDFCSFLQPQPLVVSLHSDV
ncbi:hypothetical protein QBC46DRAFT_345218 [Diplogelasinospora grovesii]|uniref:Uncharacterized protein n=1 Tax=Diplogelasinospora grovesii TaxID=303347 RepID=A0AAN6S1B6_9PEZI|nr:hypothetical protein QBC46DRAFT_345218 [Diplogelasinospora grovesii]